MNNPRRGGKETKAIINDDSETKVRKTFKFFSYRGADGDNAT